MGTLSPIAAAALGGKANQIPGFSDASSANAGPLQGTTGNLVLNFGGINLGNQDIPLTQTSSAANNAPPTVGNTPLHAFGSALSPSAGGGIGSFLPLLLIAVAVVALFLYERK